MKLTIMLERRESIYSIPRVTNNYPKHKAKALIRIMKSLVFVFSIINALKGSTSVILLLERNLNCEGLH